MLIPGGFFYLVIKPRLQLFLGVLEWLAATTRHCLLGGFQSLAELPAFWRQLRSSHWYTGGEFLDLLANNIVVITSWVLMGRWLGQAAFWGCYATVMSLSAAIFICIFFVQHNFQGSYASGTNGWNYLQGALEGSSNLVMPAIFNWFSADILLHSIHHLCERIPNYQLRACHDYNSSLLMGSKRLLIRDIPSCFRYILWDDVNFQLSSIAEARRAFAHSD
jgi:omega-6 fatty acid desaturase (delta-12 desaturase)